jgi:alkaline phosphatase D
MFSAIIPDTESRAAAARLTRRQMLSATLASATLWGKESPAVRQATGIKTGEITPDGAVIWARHTQAAARLDNGIPRRGHAPRASVLKPGEDVQKLEGAAPGAPGWMRVIAEPVSGRGRKITTGWMEVGPQTDYAHLFRLQGLQPATGYKFAVETRASGKSKESPLAGSFRTAPPAGVAAEVQFALSSCQIYCRQDRADGYHIYEAIRKLAPQFLLSCGDNVYYDSEDPIANSVTVARYHWQRMYSLPTLVNCLRTVPGYWQKDDHDVFSDDSWPGRTVAKQAPFRYEEGATIFREQTPCPVAGQPMFRRFRWGRELEIWLPDSRDYRSPNTDPDGPNKTIWGAEQKKWLKDTMTNSDATWKLMINPNPIVGPDHARKNDNHANPAFAHEGREFRQWLKDNVPGRVIVMNGDRHWQYHSVDPDTGLHEWGCGPASDEHAVPPSKGEDPRYHKFLRIKGGFVTVRLNPADAESHLVMEHRDVHGNVAHRHVYRKPA